VNTGEESTFPREKRNCVIKRKILCQKKNADHVFFGLFEAKKRFVK
jgi:hypothetical protein